MNKTSPVPAYPNEFKPQVGAGSEDPTKRCPYCGGRGIRKPVSYSIGRPWLDVTVACPFCHGSGRKPSC